MTGRFCWMIAAVCAALALVICTSAEQADARSAVVATATHHCSQISTAAQQGGDSSRALSSARLSHAQRLCKAAQPRIHTIRFWNQPKHSWTLYKRYQRYTCWALRRKHLLQGPEALCSVARGAVRASIQKLVKLDLRIRALLPKPEFEPGYLPPTQARLLGKRLAAARGWMSQQWKCLDTLWGKDESGWDVHSDNPTSDAYGIPQANPGSKMASFGRNWLNSAYAQIKWGLKYIYDTYKTPCGALRVENAQGSY